MGLLSTVLKGGTEGVLKGVGGLAKDIREAITGKATLTSEQVAELQTKAIDLEKAIMEADAQIIKGQIEINKMDAAYKPIDSSFLSLIVALFRGGWRPAVGWVCVTGLFYSFILRPILPWVITTIGFKTEPLPPMDMGALLPLLSGMLGLGGFRTYEKIKGLK